MSKQSGEQCKRHASKGRTTCASHGGKSLRGVDTPGFKSGRYSKYLPDRLLPKYHAALADEELTRLEDEIALVDSRLQEQLSLLQQHGVTPTAWDRARRTFQNFRNATNRGQRATALAALNELDGILGGNASDAVAWEGINELIEQRRRLVETERKRLADEDRVITIDRLMIMVAAIIDIIRRHVVSKDTRGAISDEIRLLVSGTDSHS
jgi:hypothetical protein